MKVYIVTSDDIKIYYAGNFHQHVLFYMETDYSAKSFKERFLS